MLSRSSHSSIFHLFYFLSSSSSSSSSSYPSPSPPPPQHDPGGSRHSSHLSDTPRGSWASSVFDLRNSVADPLLPSLLTRVPLDTVDTNNQQARQENRQEMLFVLYPPQDEEDLIERRAYPEVPMPHQAHRIQVKCINLRLELEIEPIFATMALYNLRDKKKVSENFCFDMNPEPLKRMLTSHIPYQVMIMIMMIMINGLLIRDVHSHSIGFSLYLSNFLFCQCISLIYTQTLLTLTKKKKIPLSYIIH